MADPFYLSLLIWFLSRSHGIIGEGVECPGTGELRRDPGPTARLEFPCEVCGFVLFYFFSLERPENILAWVRLVQERDLGP